MNVCFVANSAWYLENFRESTLREFSSFSSVRCLYPKGDSFSTLTELSVAEDTFFLDASSTNPIKELMSLFSLLWGLVRHRPDVVFSFNPKTNLYSLMACWMLRIPCVPNVSGVGVASQLDGIVGYTYRSLVRFFYRRADHVYFQNRDDYQAFYNAGFIRKGAAEVIPGSGVDLSKFKPDHHESENVRFLMAARLITPKGVQEYIAAARQMLAKGAECEFVLAGVKDTSNRAVREALITSLEDEPGIHFAGHVKDMPALLESIDCVVLPSYYPEGIPRSLIEAAAAGKMIITSDTPGCREVVKGCENGFLVQPKSVDDLVAAMSRLVELPIYERRKMKNASREMAESYFDENLIIERYKLTAHHLATKGKAFVGR
ncbi:glycosyltransferase family 4 protein [Halomonas taeanensis]|nr:glycosyltransferase family 4 protein [Halomonas taeanensis]